MNHYVVAPLARADMFRIWCYIAADNEAAADRVEQAILDACAMLAGSPLAGHSRAGLTRKPLRFWTLTKYPSYAIVYRPEASPVEIVAILHGKRNARRFLQSRMK